MTNKKKTFEELRAILTTKTTRKPPTDEEHRIQCSCVRWFTLKYPQYQGLLFAVPNGGRRDAVTGAKLKAEGVIAGVADLIFLKRNSRYCGLLIEMKKPKGKQSESQKEWERIINTLGEFKYVRCHSFDEFRHEVEDFLNNLEKNGT